MVTSTFADRLWWARHRAGLGATRLARMVGCAQSLISSLERNNAGKSKLSNKFAEALNVDPTWLAFGVEDRAPHDFTAENARRGREGMLRGDPASVPANVVRLPPRDSAPRWTIDTPVPTSADGLQSRLLEVFSAYAEDAGEEVTAMFLETLQHLAKTIAFKNARRQDQIRAADERHNRGAD
jgi:transcriptional regulator with XRE-family HTH domain